MIDSEREAEIRQIIQEPQYFVVLYDYFKIRIMDETRLFVAAIDFGTTYSGFAFSARGDTTIYTCEWRNNDLTSMKTPTSVLLDNEQKLKAFGYDADNKYITSIVPDEEMDEYYYFRRFKMKLHNERIKLDTMLTEERGKQMKALEIFCIAIKYLKEQMIKKLNSKFLTMKVAIKKEDIQYVLTVPAIWADQSKLFMRKAAEKADIDKDPLKLALEPEVASIYCQELRLDVEKEANRFLQTIKPGMKFMVIDLGGLFCCTCVILYIS
ncbi:Heat shock 70 kDa protein 12B,Heat shock 70 kDa protein 12A [Mytilus edulis]|uniref:Heat shock 70 kDa protein 12B,Heat shock 70 kDa protein 12A n=1 Tax=Mytilus edulis TaxID=6550 RepID=A0A8S3SG47_MYTED|nr:Heat shock 70 kDa protein 12B,Heat shock 70 kDa protein 12A [Mytilus edulis]